MATNRTVITILPEQQVKRVDKYAKSIAAGARPNRSHGIRVLLDRGLEAVTRGERSGAVPGTRRRA
jgi:hypothetical protein